jgi:hypothetical protein
VGDADSEKRLELVAPCGIQQRPRQLQREDMGRRSRQVAEAPPLK